MKLTIFGASGGTGRQLVTQALQAGHDVTAVVRQAGALPVDHARLDTRIADLLDPVAIQPALKTADAVISALGPRKGQPPTICSTATSSMIAAMRVTGMRRILAISAAPVAEHDPGDRLLYRLTARPANSVMVPIEVFGRAAKADTLTML